MRMYQVRVTRMPFLVLLTRSIVDLSPPTMIRLPGLALRGLLLLLGPVARVFQQVLDLALADDVHALARQAVVLRIERRDRGVIGIPGIGIDRDTLVEQLLADLVAAALLGQEAAAFVGLACVESRTS